jgi:hypothetical protein
MTNKIELPPTGNWLNWDLYSEEPLEKKEQDEALDNIRKHFVDHIRKEGKKDHLYLLDLHLYSDKTNDKIYKLIGNLSNMPNRNIADADLKHNHDYYASGGEVSLVVTGVPPPKPKGTDHMPLRRILVEMLEGPGKSALINKETPF